MKLLFTSSMAALLLLSGCASIEAGDQVKGLKEATDDFAEALNSADQAHEDSQYAFQREEWRSRVEAGTKVEISEQCLDQSTAARDDLVRAIQASRYSPVKADDAFNRLRMVYPCDLGLVRSDRLRGEIGPPEQMSLEPMMGSDAVTLPGTARRIQAYVSALSDIASGETAGKTDAARDRLFASGSGLLGALSVGGPVDAVLGVAKAAITGLINAKRNRATRQFLDIMDPVMPNMMERVGLAARLAQAGAAVNRARAAQTIAVWGNKKLNAGLRQATRRSGAPESRLRMFDEYMARLKPHNDEFIRVTSSDPMEAARAFAAAHHELTKVYRDPRANRKALAEGLADFQEAAAVLVEALKKPNSNDAS
ncbi:MAG TPA: hypothetical protein VF620_14440 [Allosphingosinicella sp.]|jgi:hypothetical protein